MVNDYDVIVVGSGGGLKIALPAAAMGLKTALLERESVAGTCLNRGCIPSKMLIHPTVLPGRLRAAERINVTCEGDMKVDFSALIQRTSQTVDALSERQRRSLLDIPNLDFYPFHGTFVGERTLRVGETVIRGDKVFVATGSRPRIPSIAGLRESPFMTSREALRCTRLPKRLLVIGAGYIAVELGTAYAAAGAEVTFIVRSRFLRQEDEEVAQVFSDVFSKAHSIIQGQSPVRIDFQDDLFSVTCENAEGRENKHQAEALLVATGVVPCTDDLGLARTGVQVNVQGYVQVDAHLRTTCPGVYALGDCVGNYLFRHTVNHEGEYLVRSVLKGQTDRPLDYGPVPHAVFSDPEIAGVGFTEKEAQVQGREFVVGRSYYQDSNAGLARGYRHGLVKLLVDRHTRRLLVPHILGEEASDLIHILITAMKLQGTLSQLADMIFIHPALPEVVRDAIRDASCQLKI